MSDLRKAVYLATLLKTQWFKKEELEKLQLKKLRRILKHAYQNIPLYHEKFKKAGVKPEEIKSIEDLTKLPYTTKSEVKKNFPHKIIAPHIILNKCWTPHTSGSTGTPLTVVYDSRAEDFEKAVALRANLSCGQRLFDKWVVFTDPRHIKPQRWFQRFGLFSPIRLSLFMPVEKQIESLLKIKPDIIDTYPSQLYILAKNIKKENIKISPKLIFSTAELLDPMTRRYIENAFNAPVYDQYGCVEFGRTAWECPERNGFHMDMEAVVTEFIRDEEHVTPGEKGEIVYTTLYNYAMPLIRYRIGDIGIPTDEKCNCGRGLSLIKKIEGRKADFLLKRDGTLVSPITIDLIVKNIMEIDECRLIQENLDEFSFLIVPSAQYNDSVQEKLDKALREIFGDDIKVSYAVVDKLPRDSSGKLRMVISKVGEKRDEI